MMSKPFLKWAGGKHKLVPFIQDYLPKHTNKRLIEPFSGAASLSLALNFESYLLNDINIDLINVFKLLKQEKKSFIDYAKSFFIAENNQEKKFYDLREQFNFSENISERSALFIYLNRHAFNGLCRYNRKGKFNVPFGRYQNPYFPEIELQNFVNKSERVELMSGDFQQALAVADNGDVIYCDPPYVPLNQTASFTNYAQEDFILLDQQRLVKQAKQVIKQADCILISNHDTDFTRKLYASAYLVTIQVQRNIAAKGSSRKKVNELLAVYNRGLEI